MSYPTPMDIAESEDKAINALDEALDWPYSREVWDQIDAERVELLAANEALSAELTECMEKRERYALQVCLLLDAMREAGVHIDEKWCWCQPTVENHSSDCAVHNEPALSNGPCSCGATPSFDGTWHKLECPEK